MSVTRQEIEESAKLLIRNATLPSDIGFQEGEFGEMLRLALDRYSKDRPLKDLSDMTGDGSTFDFSLPTAWDDAISSALSVEYPQGEQSPVFLQRKDWTIYAAGTSAQMFRFLTLIPASGKTARLIYTRRHTISETASETTIYGNDLAAFIKLVAAEACHELARRFAQTSAPTIAADAIDYESKSAEYTRLAKDLMRQYMNQLGMKEGDTAGPAGATLDLDFGLSQSRGDYLTHGSRGER